MGGSDGRYGGPVSAVLNGLRDVVRSRRQAETSGPQPDPRGDAERVDGAWCLVTGASSGLGFETAVRLIERGANLLVASRSAGPDLVQRLRERTSVPNEPAIEAVPLDLASLASVDAFVEEIARRNHRFGVVVFNAGVVSAGARTTVDGFDEMLQVNYLANHALATQLVRRGCVAVSTETADSSDAFGDTGRPPRFVFVSSEAHRSAPDVPAIDPFAVGAYGVRESMRWYGYSKLLLTAFTGELARRHAVESEQPLTVLTMCPGAMSTSIARDAPRSLQPLIRLVFRLFFPGPERSAETLAHLACSPTLDQSSGRYYHLGTEKEKDPRAHDPELAGRLWNEAERAVAAAVGS